MRDLRSVIAHLTEAADERAQAELDRQYEDGDEDE